MLGITKRVDHRNRGKQREVLKVTMSENPGDNGIHPKRKIPRYVLNGLPLSKLAFDRAQQHRPAAKLPDGDFEGDPRPQRRLLKDHRHRFPLQRPGKCGFRAKIA